MDKPSQQPVLSIIIISFNTKHITQDCLDSVFEHTSTPQFEVVVIDNASSDGSVEMLNAYAAREPRLTFIQSATNDGFAKANNRAAMHARGDLLLFLNSDILVLDRAIEKLVTYFQKHEGTIQFLGGKLLNKDRSPQASAGPFYSLPVIFGALFLRGDYWGLTRSSPNTAQQVDWVSGACILTRKEYYFKLSGFDEQIFMYMDEIDLLYRAKKMGYQTWFYPQAQFIHLGSASSNGKTYPILQVYRGFIYFYQKHHSRGSMFFLKIMLQLKAVVAVWLGKITQNHYLIHTYGEAYKLAQMA